MCITILSDSSVLSIVRPSMRSSAFFISAMHSKSSVWT